MSFRAVTEAVVHFETFRNVDLFHQGIYFLRTSLYYQKDQNVSVNFDHTTILALLRITLHGLQPESNPRGG
jgi:hypothetical protein